MKRVQGLVAAILWAVASYPSASRADDCATIVRALSATAEAPALSQYITMPGRGERLMSVILGDTAYMAVAGTGGWQKLPRGQVEAAARRAAADALYSDCKRLGVESINGVPATAYEYRLASRSNMFPPGQATVWIGPDGLVLKQESKGASLRYEYRDVTAPVP